MICNSLLSVCGRALFGGWVDGVEWTEWVDGVDGWVDGVGGWSGWTDGRIEGWI